MFSFTPLFTVLFTFPSQYWFTIGLSVVFSLTRWCWQFQTGRLRPRPTQDTTMPNKLTFTGLSPSMACLPRQFKFIYPYNHVVLQPSSRLNEISLGYSPFARHYLGNHYIV